MCIVIEARTRPMRYSATSSPLQYNATLSR
jgi:hypothetical protein